MRPTLVAVAGLLFAGALAHAEPAPCRAPGRGARVDLDLRRGMRLDELASWARAMTCRPVEYAAELAGRTTRLAIEARGVTADDAFAVLVAAAHTMNLEVKKAGKRLRIVATGAEPGGGEAAGASAGESAGSAPRAPLEVRRIDDTHVEVDAAGVAALDLSAEASSVRIVPAFADGRATGFKLFGLRSGSLLSRLGFKNGDVVHSVNGRPLTSPDRALEAYEALKTERRFVVEITRGGQPTSLTVSLR